MLYALIASILINAIFSLTILLLYNKKNKEKEEYSRIAISEKLIKLLSISYVLGKLRGTNSILSSGQLSSIAIAMSKEIATEGNADGYIQDFLETNNKNIEMSEDLAFMFKNEVKTFITNFGDGNLEQAEEIGELSLLD